MISSNILKNEKGFTLIETLLSLIILMIISTFLIMFLSSLFYRVHSRSIHPFELENFVRQAKIELRESTRWSVNNNILTFTMPDGRIATYNQHQNVLRKQVQGRGHEILIQNISSVLFTPLKNGIKITIEDISGKSYERIITYIGYYEEGD